jgi:hypothetical protein
MTEYIQTIAAEAARLATVAAMNGSPSQVIWIPPQNGTSRHYGNFAVVAYPPIRSAADEEPWNTRGI